MKLFDRNKKELKDGDIVYYQNNKKDVNRVVIYNDDFYLTTIPNEKGTLFDLRNFEISGNFDESITILEFTKI